MKVKLRWVLLLLSLVSLGLATLTSCKTGGGPNQSESREGSTPLNPQEAIRYKQALIRCHKTGGTRIVKISGVLRCF